MNSLRLNRDKYNERNASINDRIMIIGFILTDTICPQKGFILILSHNAIKLSRYSTTVHLLKVSQNSRNKDTYRSDTYTVEKQFRNT